MIGLSKRLASRVGLLEPARQLRDTLRAWRHQLSEERSSLPTDGLPIPSGRLILKVAGTPDARWFLEGGRRAADSIRGSLARHNITVESVPSLLDFGCGCGRVARYWKSVQGEVHGTDYEPSGIAWCKRNLKFGRFAVNGLHPPLPYPAGRFHLIYALSVFTHLPADLQEPWMDELRRVLAPGGHLIVSLHGTAYTELLTPAERSVWDSGQIVIREGAPGSNVFGAYHPEAYIRGPMTKGFRLLELMPEGATGNPRQDLILFQRT